MSMIWVFIYVRVWNGMGWGDAVGFWIGIDYRLFVVPSARTVHLDCIGRTGMARRCIASHRLTGCMRFCIGSHESRRHNYLEI